MARICTKCKSEISDSDQPDPAAQTYPCCTKCWAEWKTYRIMVMNELRLDMSLPEHRKLLKKNEKIFVGVLSPQGDMIDFTNENNRKPDQPAP